MHKLVVSNIFFLLFSFNISIASESHYKNVFFDAVEKKLSNLEILDPNMSILFSKWYDNNIKVNGIDGKLLIDIISYNENILNIDDGKRLDIQLKISMKILKNNDNFEKKEYFYEINEFGKIQGNFSLNEFDELKDSIRKNVILRLSKKIQNN